METWIVYEDIELFIRTLQNKNRFQRKSNERNNPCHFFLVNQGKANTEIYSWSQYVRSNELTFLQSRTFVIENQWQFLHRNFTLAYLSKNTDHRKH